jgi:hypothetical protein
MGCLNGFKFILDLGFKNQRIQNIFKLKFELDYTKINLNKLFGDFSNLELLEIDLNNQDLKRKTFKLIKKKISK